MPTTEYGIRGASNRLRISAEQMKACMHELDPPEKPREGVMAPRGRQLTSCGASVRRGCRMRAAGPEQTLGGTEEAIGLTVTDPGPGHKDFQRDLGGMDSGE